MANAYDNFIPELWSESIEKTLEASLVFAEGCTREYEGEVKNAGDTVHILTIGRPTIRTIASTAMNSADIAAPEEISSSDLTLLIDQIRYYNCMVGDFEKAQALPGVLEKITEETAYGLASAIDTYIAALADGSTVTKNNASATALTTSNVFTQIDTAAEKLYLNNVPMGTQLELIVPVKFYTILKQAFIANSTNNVQEIKHGKVYLYGDITIKVSNNVKKVSASGTDTYHCMLRTKKAVAFVKQLSKTEAYRPQARFADAIKGYVLFGAKVVRAAEIIDVNVTI